MNQVMPTLIHGAYLASTILLILGLPNLRSPASAIGGNRLAALGMLVAVLAAVFDAAVLNVELILLGLIVGALIGSLAARYVEMTAMPQLVGMFNGFGGGASALVAIGEYQRLIGTSTPPDLYTMLIILLGMLIGAVTLSGSLVAFGKLQGIVAGAPVAFRFQQPVHGLLILLFLAGVGVMVQAPATQGLFLALLGLALLLGGLFVLPIGSADMPVVISLLNACSGLAASAAGFVVQNPLLIIAGALVGASGVILTQMMCTSMNRSLAHVLFGTFGQRERATDAAGVSTEKVVRRVDVEEAAMMLAYARTVVIVPGYGMAVAQAQHAVYELAAQLKRTGSRSPMPFTRLQAACQAI